MSRLSRELEIAQKIAFDVSKVILSHYDSDYEVMMKAGEEPVTIADKHASQFIVDALHRAFPKDAIVSEESPLPTDLDQHERIWVIDPIDGTKEFIKHNGEFAVMIGLVQEGHPILGVVYQPVTQMMCWGVEGQGAFMGNGSQKQALHVSQASDLNDLRIATSRSHFSDQLQKLYDDLGLKNVVRCGSLGLKFALIARQLSEIYFNLSNITSCWDTCAPEVILKEAGGRISNLSGTRLTYTFSHVKNRNGVVATNGPIHDYLVEQIQGALADKAARINLESN